MKQTNYLSNIVNVATWLLSAIMRIIFLAMGLILGWASVMLLITNPVRESNQIDNMIMNAVPFIAIIGIIAAIFIIAKTFLSSNDDLFEPTI